MLSELTHDLRTRRASTPVVRQLSPPRRRRRHEREPGWTTTVDARGGSGGPRAPACRASCRAPRRRLGAAVLWQGASGNSEPDVALARRAVPPSRAPLPDLWFLAPAAGAYDACAPPILLRGGSASTAPAAAHRIVTDDAGRGARFSPPSTAPFRGGRQGAYSELPLLPAGSPRGSHGAWRAQDRTPRGNLLLQSPVRGLPLEAGLPLRGASHKGVRSPSYLPIGRHGAPSKRLSDSSPEHLLQTPSMTPILGCILLPPT